MALIIEDGTIVSNANSYCSLTEIRAFALARGVTLSATDSVVEVLAIKAMDYLQSLWEEFQGSLVDKDQPLLWPRKNVKIEGFDFPEDQIPLDLKSAQSQLCIEINNGVDLFPTVDGQFVTLKKIDVLETRFSESLSSDKPTLHSVNKYLFRLFNQNMNYLKVVRV